MSRMMSRNSVIVAAALFAAACSGGKDGTPRVASGEVDVSGARHAGVADPLADRADSLIRAGRPWRATVLLAQRLATPASASPELRLVGARAAAAWDGWTEVERILRDAPWLDTEFNGEGRELLARSALERNADALGDATLALEDSKDNTSLAIREVLLARAHDRANARDSAAMHYSAAASKLNRVADWLQLRAAGVTDDSAHRAQLLAQVRTTVARGRMNATDAQARERRGDFAGAAAAFRKAGAEASALRVESLAATDSGSRAALKSRIVGYLQRAPSSGEARQSLELLDKLGALSASDELVAARAANAAGVSARAVAGFARAAASAPLSAPDRMTYAAALVRAGKSTEAQRIYASITEDPKIAPLAAYQKARLIAQSGGGAAAKASLRFVATQYTAIRAAAAPALLLLADLQVDDNELAAAAATLRELVSRHADAAQAPLARFRLGLLQWSDTPDAAARSFDSLAVTNPRDEEALAARYWSARAYERVGNRAKAEQAWQAVITASPLSYYAMAAARRLKIAGWSPPPDSGKAARSAPVDSAVERVRILRRLGMDVEATFERDALAARATATPAEAPAVVQALDAIGEPARALRVALAAIEGGNHSRALYLAAYPILHDDALLDESRKNGLDPALVAGLIRQESSWNPRAISPANARGLMQLLPSVGAAIATSKKYPLWNTALLLEPDVSLELGTAHLASSLKRDTPAERALAAYNAGGSRVARWIQRPGTDDPELFTEWIPFTETRDYVRLVLRNAAIYRSLYDMK